MTLLTRLGTIAGAAVLALPLTACGGDSEFCDQLDDLSTKYSGTQNALVENPEMMNNLVADMRSIAESAPDDIRSEWENYVDTFDSLVSMSEEDDAADAATAIAELESSRERLDEHAMQECDVQLS
ncbi:hypothetical protein G1H11_06610 [Phytoactinopolyspora alkaliphila]|uniref:Uncharacterized protein n=1 Tax=Phytoactinopolyspora alkaliphila TaxID=1783498 RepID=A0A6N9YIW3_9ACTN|nr:hypothetical protein [Phytoactinopolyspora alkaliphila]NED94981.1 hypothetical protein [Phytoactinopolyspora alkaliphila]